MNKKIKPVSEGRGISIEIETVNVFFRIALDDDLAFFENFYKSIRYKHFESPLPQYKKLLRQKHLCIIDLSSFHSLREVFFRVIEKKRMTKFVFIGDNRILSKILSSFVYADTRSNIDDILSCLLTRWVSYDEVVKYIAEHLELSFLTYHDLMTIYGLVTNERVSDAARISGCKAKLYYQRVNKLTKRLNLQSGCHTHFFYWSEFSAAYVKSKLLSREPRV